jgi:flagellar motor switch protein FliG
LALEVISRMLRMDAVQKEVLEKVEQTLRVEFMSNLTNTSRRDSHEMMADIFNNFDRQTEARFLAALEEDNREAADRIKTLMFTFDDLLKLDAASCQTLLRHVEKDQLAIALKGSTDAAREFFFWQHVFARREDVAGRHGGLGTGPLRDVDDAQTGMVNQAKDFAAKGEIMISKSKGDDEIIY